MVFKIAIQPFLNHVRMLGNKGVDSVGIRKPEIGKDGETPNLTAEFAQPFGRTVVGIVDGCIALNAYTGSPRTDPHGKPIPPEKARD